MNSFPPLSSVCQPIFKSVNDSIHVVAKSILASSNVCEPIKRLYQCKPVKVACSSSISKQSAGNVRSVSKSVKPLTVTKPVCKSR